MPEAVVCSAACGARPIRFWLADAMRSRNHRSDLNPQVHSRSGERHPHRPQRRRQNDASKNIAHQALIAGHTVLCTVAGQLLGDLTASESDAAVRRRLRQYSAPDVLVIDEIAYLSSSNRHADLLFELLNRRATKRRARSLPRTNRSRNGRRSSRAQVALYRSSTDSSIVPKSSQARASRSASKKPKSDRIRSSDGAVRPKRQSRSR